MTRDELAFHIAEGRRLRAEEIQRMAQKITWPHCLACGGLTLFAIVAAVYAL